MDYESVYNFAETWGLVYMLLLFAGVLVYALRPKARAEFDRLARLPLDED